MPAAEENDGGDGAQQKQQEKEGTLDAVGSQQDEESGGDHDAGKAGGDSAAGLEGGGTGTRAGRTPGRRARASAAQRVMPGARGPAPSPMAAHPAPAALRE